MRTIGKEGIHDPTAGENRLRLRTSDWCLAALLAAGAATFLYALFRRKSGVETLLYARPRGGERDGGFELFIGS